MLNSPSNADSFNHNDDKDERRIFELSWIMMTGIVSSLLRDRYIHHLYWTDVKLREHTTLIMYSYRAILGKESRDALLLLGYAKQATK